MPECMLCARHHAAGYWRAAEGQFLLALLKPAVNKYVGEQKIGWLVIWLRSLEMNCISNFGQRWRRRGERSDSSSVVTGSPTGGAYLMLSAQNMLAVIANRVATSKLYSKGILFIKAIVNIYLYVNTLKLVQWKISFWVLCQGLHRELYTD